MRFFTLSSIFLATVINGVLAGQNCKCQDPSGTGPQFDDLTNACCSQADTGCPLGSFRFPGPNNQCSAEGTNCINSGAFNNCCLSKGAPGAFCF